jgi:hypothetical protein
MVNMKEIFSAGRKRIIAAAFGADDFTADFEVVDLCGLTAKLDTSAGDISGTDITISQLDAGTIVFVKTGGAQSWQVWSGIVNSIKLKAKHDGDAVVTYIIQ